MGKKHFTPIKVNVDEFKLIKQCAFSQGTKGDPKDKLFKRLDQFKIK